MAAIEITRKDLTATELRAASAMARDAKAARRMLAIARVLAGKDRKTAAETCGMDRQTLRDWAKPAKGSSWRSQLEWLAEGIRYSAQGLAGLENRKGPGRPPRLTAQQKAELAALVEQVPDAEKDGVARWRRADLKRRIEERFGVKRRERTVGKPRKALGYVRLSVTPHHQNSDPQAQQAFKKNFPAAIAALLPERARGKPLEIWFQDEPSIRHSSAPRAPEPLAHCARIGQPGALPRLWAKQGSRPRAPRDRRRAWAELAKGSGRRSLLEWPAEGYLFGAVCPARRATAARVLPYANAEAFSLHLAKISKEVASGAHAILTLDGAGYHAAADLKTPDNITLLPLPSYSPELNPMENVWERLRKNQLAISVDDAYRHSVEKSRAA